MRQLAVVCNYKLNPTRIGGMDRFFVAYDKACKLNGFDVKWFFSGGRDFDFYTELHIEMSREASVEKCFLAFLQNNDPGFEIVVTHFVELCTPFFKKVKAFGNAHIIAVDHNPRPPEGFPLKKRLKNKLKGKLYSRYIDGFIGVSHYTVDCILQDYGSSLSEKTQTVYNGIDTSIYLQRTSENRGKFIVASHLRKSKGIQDLIEAVNILPKNKKRLLEIDIFGEGPMEVILKEKIKEYNLEPQFSFKGSSPNLPELFQFYSFLLQPTYMECFSLSILESLAANVPVITTPVGGNPEIISEGENGFLFKPGDVAALAKILEKVLQQEKKIEKDVSLLIKQQFTLEKMVKEHLDLLPCT